MDVVYSRLTRPMSNCKAWSGADASRLRIGPDPSVCGAAMHSGIRPLHRIRGQLALRANSCSTTACIDECRPMCGPRSVVSEESPSNGCEEAPPSRAMPSRYGLGRRPQGGARRPSDWLSEDDTSAHRGVLDARDPKDETRARFDRVVQLGPFSAVTSLLPSRQNS